MTKAASGAGKQHTQEWRSETGSEREIHLNGSSYTKLYI